VRSPYWDARLKGTIYGLTADHGPGHLARALLEAVAFDLRAILEIMEASVRTSPRLVLTGGLSRSPILPQLLADVLGREIAVPDESEGSIGGAAIMALRGAGMVEGLGFAGGPPSGRAVAPDPIVGDLYANRYREHGRLVSALRVLQLQGGPAAGVSAASAALAGSGSGSTGTCP
jgi:sugar (pentulose or hexulose) kinase